MTDEQYANWLDFAKRMAKTCHRRNKRVLFGVEDFIGQYDGAYVEINDWDGNQFGTCIGDDMHTYLFDRQMERDNDNGGWTTPTGRAIMACVRAGIDMASKPSGGVVGYTVGDLRRMYPEGLPAWLLEAFGPPAAQALMKARDSEGVWL